MPSTYTTNLGIEKIATGEQSGTWGTTTNTNFDLIDTAVNGIVSITLASAGTSGSPNDLPITDGTASNGRNKFIEFTDGGDLGATAYVQLTPNDAEKVVHIRNSLSGSRSIIVFQGTYNASNDFEIPNGADVTLKFDGAGTGATVTDVNVDLTVTGLTATSTVSFSGATIDNLGTVTTVDINGGTIDGTVIGGSSAAAGTFTTFTSTGIDDNATSTAITIDSSENVGIGGSADPFSRFYGRMLGVSSASSSFLEINAATGNTSGIDFGVNGARTAGITSNTTETNISTLGSTPLNFATNTSTRMTIASGGNVGIGTSSPANKLDVNGILQSSSVGNYLQLQQSSTDGYINMTGSGGLNFRMGSGFDTRMTIDSSGNVGIGTTSYTSRLTVEDSSSGAETVPITLRNSGSSAVGTETKLLLSTVAGDNRGAFISSIITSVSNDNALLFGTNVAGAAPTERMRIDSNGNVGIGTASPDGTFHVKDAIAQVYIQSNDGQPSQVVFGDVSDASGGMIEYTSSNEMAFKTNNLNERMRIDSSGKVGIGTTSPSSPLTVKGTIGFEATNSTNRWSVYTYTDNTLRFNFNGSGADEVVIDSSGNVGIGTESPASALHVDSSNDGPLFDSGGTGNTNHALLVRDSNLNQLFRVNNNGKVGIGTESPAYVLDVYNSAVSQISASRSGGSRVVLGTDTSTGEYVGTISNTVFKILTNSTERMRIDTSGNLLVGKTAASGFTLGAEIKADGTGQFTVDNNPPLFANRKSSDGAIITFAKDNTTVGSIISLSGIVSGIVFDPRNVNSGGAGIAGTNGDSIVPMDRLGTSDADIDLGIASTRWRNLYLSGGAYLGGTGSANHLDDYEEGTFTPTLSGVNMGGTAGYVKIGKSVTITFDVSVPAGTTASNLIGGLPFNCIDRHGTCNVIYAQTATAITGGYVVVGNNQITLIVDGGTAGTNLQQNDRIIGAAHYFAA